MKTTFRLLGSVALAAVGASMVHAQALGYNASEAYVNILGAPAGVYTAYAGTYYTFFGPGGFGGNAFSYDTVGFINGYGGGQFSESYGESYAFPNGQSYEGGYIDNEFDVINTTDAGVFVSLAAYTASYSFAGQLAAGDSAYGEGFGEVIFDGYTLVQFSEAIVEADNYFGVGNWTLTENYDLLNGFSSAYYRYANGSPFIDSVFASDYQYYTLYLPAYSTAFFDEISYTEHAATSVRGNANGTPGPAAVAPFAVGLLGALRRRKRS